MSPSSHLPPSVSLSPFVSPFFLTYIYFPLHPSLPAFISLLLPLRYLHPSLSPAPSSPPPPPPSLFLSPFSPPICLGSVILPFLPPSLFLSLLHYPSAGCISLPFSLYSLCLSLCMRLSRNRY